MNTHFFKAAEIAEILKISKALAYRLIAQGELGAVRFGRTVRVRQEDLDDFLARSISEPNGAFEPKPSSASAGERSMND